MRVVDNTSAKFGHNHPFNTGIGIPIARESDDGQGTVTFLFREMKTSTGEPSDRILGVTNKHVATLDTTTDYVFDEANPQYILVCGNRRLDRAISEIEEAAIAGVRDASRLSREFNNTPEENTTALRRRKIALEEKNEDIVTLQALEAEVKTSWQDTNGRRFGVVDYAPHISVRVDDRHYTRDIATFVVNGEKLQNFESNIYHATQLEDLFWPTSAIRDDRRIPGNLQLPIRAALSRRLTLNPDTTDMNGEPGYIVAKYGNTTKLTLGRYSGMESYISKDIGLESREVAMYNYTKTSGDFSCPGDSGSLIFTGDGNALAMLHSGMHQGMHRHVTYATPLWWVIKQILVKYPYAEFYGMAYTLE
ncbi:hypothetical protein DACRYDRAFT_93143 [Dacryopinax primogenitus]|uniref:Uncharacterized protein n=1 Tax=Dacryopinax primogenitus (strain DJM 731) TaxID=1858805 RepID=M5G373_DACPD|nr:uncharacterized protein DACRYDRAFT_93143 [Dacryopinax primogenitus]EJU04671.1 hypothetical protein DACRYDRAFT_93143 [Dacryopinax primogenitus]